MSEAIGALLTFTTYGTHLHGTDTSSVSRRHRNWGGPTLLSNAAWQHQARRLMSETEFSLGKSDRALVLKPVVNTCTHRAWHLYCIHVRTQHIHVILQADVPVDRALSYLKARATFALKTRHPDRQRFWTKHGSTRYLWNRASLTGALDYVMNQQGSPMESWIERSLA